MAMDKKSRDEVIETDGSFFADLKQMERKKFKDDPEMLAFLDAEDAELEREPDDK